MGRAFRLFEPVTGQQVGSLQLQEDMLPGSVALRYFQQGVVLIEEASEPEQSEPSKAAPSKPKKHK